MPAVMLPRSLRLLALAAVSLSTSAALALDITRFIDFESGPEAGPDAGLANIIGTTAVQAIDAGVTDLTGEGKGLGGGTALRLDGNDPFVGTRTFPGGGSGALFEGFWAANDGSGSLPAGAPLTANTGSGVVVFSFYHQVEQDSNPTEVFASDQVDLALTYSDENKMGPGGRGYRPLQFMQVGSKALEATDPPVPAISYKTRGLDDQGDGPVVTDVTPPDQYRKITNYLQLFPDADDPAIGPTSFLQVINEAGDQLLGFDAVPSVPNPFDRDLVRPTDPFDAYDGYEVRGLQLFLGDFIEESVHLFDNITIGLIDAADIDLVTGDIGTTNMRSDFTADGQIDAADRLYLIEEILASEVGDVNLDRTIDQSDIDIVTANQGLTSASYADGDVTFDGVVNGDDLALLTGGGNEPGDFNADGRIDNGDLNLLLGSWGASSVPSEWTNGFDGPTVDNEELNALLGGWGLGTSAVPEPISSVLLMIGVAAHAARRQRG